MNKFTQFTAVLLIMCWNNNVISDDFLAKHRLFYSPQQRQALDAAQRLAIQNTLPPATMADQNTKVLISSPPELIFNGYLISPDRELLWINGMPWDHRKGQSMPVDGIRELTWQTELRRLVVVNTTGDIIYLQPGESFAESAHESNKIPGE